MVPMSKCSTDSFTVEPLDSTEYLKQRSAGLVNAKRPSCACIPSTSVRRGYVRRLLSRGSGRSLGSGDVEKSVKKVCRAIHSSMHMTTYFLEI